MSFTFGSIVFDEGPPLKGIGPEHLRDKLILPSHISTSLYGTVGDITAIDPDDPATAGTTGRLADAGHQHDFTTIAPSSLTKTASNTEGSSGDGVRGDHGHATSALPWGIVARMTPLTVDNGAHTTNATTDMSISGVVVDVARLYEVVFKTTWLVSAGAYWRFNFHVGGTLVDSLGEIQTSVAEHGPMNTSITWEPSSGTVNVDVRVVEVAAGGDLTLEGAANKTRKFYIKDIGLR